MRASGTACVRTGRRTAALHSPRSDRAPGRPAAAAATRRSRARDARRRAVAGRSADTPRGRCGGHPAPRRAQAWGEAGRAARACGAMGVAGTRETPRAARGSSTRRRVDQAVSRAQPSAARTARRHPARPACAAPCPAPGSKRVNRARRQELVRVSPHAGGDPGEPRRAQGGGLHHRRALDRGAQRRRPGTASSQLVRRRAAVHAQRRVEMPTRVARCARIASSTSAVAVRHRLERRAGEVRARRAARQPDDRAARLGLPVRRAEPRRAPARSRRRRCRRDRARQRLASPRAADDVRARRAATGPPRRRRRSTPPAHRRARRSAPQAIVVSSPPPPRGRCTPALQQQERARAVRVLGDAGRASRPARRAPPAGRPRRRGSAARSPSTSAQRSPKSPMRRAHLRQHAPRHAEAARAARRSTRAARCRRASCATRWSDRSRARARPSAARRASVDRARQQLAPLRARRARRVVASSHSSFVALKYGSTTSPVRAASHARARRELGAAAAVRRSCQTMRAMRRAGRSRDPTARRSRAGS